MKIYDCFTFYNELDLLEIRLRELYNTVDHFVIVESNQTFTNRPKQLIFKQHQDRFQEWADKIIHVQHTSPAHNNPWLNETAQRNAILLGLASASDEDLVIVSDDDEVLRASSVKQMHQMNCNF